MWQEYCKIEVRSQVALTTVVKQEEWTQRIENIFKPNKNTQISGIIFWKLKMNTNNFRYENFLNQPTEMANYPEYSRGKYYFNNHKVNLDHIQELIDQDYPDVCLRTKDQEQWYQTTKHMYGQVMYSR